MLFIVTRNTNSEMIIIMKTFCFADKTWKYAYIIVTKIWNIEGSGKTNIKRLSINKTKRFLTIGTYDIREPRTE